VRSYTRPLVGHPNTLGALRDVGYVARTVREEMRSNLVEQLGRGEKLFPGILGYDDTVIPELENAILSGHHIVLLGERGQGKTRLIRGLVELLDSEIPAIDGCEINDDPVRPICATCRRRVSEEGSDLRVKWVRRESRYGEKLATPDVTIGDLIGEIDPVRIAEGRYLADEETIHFGILPRTHRGIFAINELPDLAEKVQVGLFNIMEERDFQIKGFKVRMPLDVLVVATANPEDYTSRGRIVTPLKDRFDVQVRTHYPRTIEDEIAIMEQEVSIADRNGRPVRVPAFLREIIARITFEARSAPEISQSSGVSVRVSLNNLETVIANAEKRAIRCGEREIVPRITDLPAVVASTIGKIELDYGADHQGDALVDRVINRAVKTTFDRHVELDRLSGITDYIGQGWGVAVSDSMPSQDYTAGIATIPGLREAIDRLGPFESPALMACAAELVLEGLHLHNKLDREREGGRMVFKA
jgi:magnesium chelatase subunit I